MRLTKDAGAEQDPAKRLELYKQAEKILSEEEAAYAPIYYYSAHQREQALADPNLPEARRTALGQVDDRLGGQGSGHQVGLPYCNAMQLRGSCMALLRRQLALVTHCRRRPGFARPEAAQTPVSRQRLRPTRCVAERASRRQSSISDRPI